ncbi:MAG: HAMP domain-containing protein [Planctomycetaceae bacterium]|nr:MAG: HAMP domain-containing protein [Planctomycetaceae bacterium]
MRVHSVRTRFLLAAALLVMMAASSGLWSVATFLYLSTAIDQTVRDRQAAVDWATSLAHSLEREDDALLLSLSGRTEAAQRELSQHRLAANAALEALTAHEDAGQLDGMRQRIAEYRRAGDDLISSERSENSLARYHVTVNPLLRQAVAECAALREGHFDAMQQAAVLTRDRAVRGTRWVIGVSLLSLLLGVMAAAWLARSVLLPIRQLIASARAIRSGQFDSRLDEGRVDEFGQLTEAFNRMAESLAEYQRSSLGELLASKATLQSTLNALPDAVLLFGPAGGLVDQNPHGERLLIGLGCPDARGLKDLPLPDDFRESVEAALAGTAQRPMPLDFRQTMRVNLDGTQRSLMMTAIPVRGLEIEPGPRTSGFGAVVVFDDVTEFAKLDELRSELIGVASHELKSPLTTLRMNLLMLRETADRLDAHQRELLDTANSGCDELELTIEELLDVTRVEAGQLRLNLDQIDLRNIVLTAQEGFRIRFEDAEVRLIVLVPPDPVVVRADAKRLANVIANLLANALKYAPAGSDVGMEVGVGQASGTSDAKVSVTDRGPGIPPKYYQRVFEKFFRVEHATMAANRPEHRLAGGTGIGLYLCREIIRAHGGQIVCQSGDDQQGTCVTFTLPLARPDHE